MASNILRELIRLIGLPAALTLTRVYGGRTLRVPSRATSVHPLTVSLGAPVAEVLCREYAGIELDVPSERTALLEHRNRLICQEYGQGSSIKSIARRYGITRTMVRKVLRASGVFTSSTP